MRIGVLSVQGDARENLDAAGRALEAEGRDGSAVPVKTAEGMGGIDALVIPGGESTAIGAMCGDGLLGAIRDAAGSGMPVLGICAGLVLLSRTVSDRVAGATGQPLLGALDVTLERNHFGRQSSSFEAEISLDPIGIPRFNGVFIRAPAISEAGAGVEVLSRLGKSITAVKKGRIMATAFHPELAGDLSVHRHFVGLV